MKRLFLTLILVISLFAAKQTVAYAFSVYTYSFSPTPKDLYDLDHYSAYKWGIKWAVPDGQTITGANIFIDNINDWKVESNDILYVDLLNTNFAGVRTYADNQGGGDYFLGNGIRLTTYTDDDTGSNPAEDWAYTFTSAQVDILKAYASDKYFGLGFDPDCHYYNDGIKLNIITASPTPEPATLSLFGLGLLGLAGLKRKKDF